MRFSQAKLHFVALLAAFTVFGLIYYWIRLDLVGRDRGQEFCQASEGRQFKSERARYLFATLYCRRAHLSNELSNY